MDWQNLRSDWNRLRGFLATAEQGSLSAAARALQMSQPTLGRQVAALEAELGLTLFERHGTGLHLTEAGMQLAEHARAMGEAAERLARVASGQQQQIAGQVTITASEIYAAWLLPQLLPKIRAAAPGLTIEILASNAIRDLKRREADIALRNARPGQPDLIARRIADDRGSFYATSGYLATLPPIEALPDLAAAEFIAFEDPGPYGSFLRELGVPVTEANFPLVSSSHLVHWQMARAGLGIGVGPLGLGDPDPQLVRALPSLEIPYPVWLVAHRELHTSRRIRLVYDLLAELIPPLLRTS
ncbi:LysR family transcriptional regulator [Yangia mangrovi]|uniref:LysR family transcriptional regulator n=2 Tax=Alloyangia mangrovi TaxID=1779329 RepID=A0ABT2KSQ6_9RHOB|nr:LysR family transcriptional regulator [Alloyangia mangrovi]MCA0940383.1 LysR family transcriptional regulator [Alloyangia pacifica]MCA0945220.1 LysR family transcriptional regulator [Alloyangia pacifica]MCT4373196.1 LysR family transcriptional regulator [Alloyangia mangrovi]